MKFAQTKTLKKIGIVFDFLKKKNTRKCGAVLTPQIVAAQKNFFSIIILKKDSPDRVHQIGYNLLHQYF